MSRLFSPIKLSGREMAESIGIEPMRRFHVYGLANRCITTLSTYQNGGEGRTRTFKPQKGADLQSAVITIRQPLQNDGESGIEPVF